MANIVSVDYLLFFFFLLCKLTSSILGMQVGVKDLRFIGSQCWAMMREGEAEKQVSFVNSYRNIVTLTQLKLLNYKM